MNSFMTAQFFSEILDKLKTTNENLYNVVDICFLVIDLMFVVGLFLAFFGLILSVMKYGLRIIKRNSDETDEREVINWKKELKDSIKGFAIFVGALLALPIFSWILIAILGSVIQQ